jgi:ketosteroid isomerase-like protein
MAEPWADELAAIRAAFGLFSSVFAGDDVEPYLESIHPEVEWVPMMAVLEGRVYHGHEGVRQWFEDLRHDWEVFTPVLEELRPLGDCHFLGLGHWEARGRGSGVDLGGRQPATWLVRTRNGRIDRLQTFTDRDEGLKAAESLRSAD